MTKKLHPDPGRAANGKRTFGSRVIRVGGARERVEDTRGRPRSMVFGGGRSAFPEPGGSQLTWQVGGGDSGGVHSVPSGALFLLRRAFG